MTVKRGSLVGAADFKRLERAVIANPMRTEKPKMPVAPDGKIENIWLLCFPAVGTKGMPGISKAQVGMPLMWAGLPPQEVAREFTEGRRAFWLGGLSMLTWEESDEEAAVRADLTFYDPASKVLSTCVPGSWVIVFYEAHNTVMEWLRLYVWTEGVTDAVRSETRITGYDPLSRLQMVGEEPVAYRANKAHPNGWTLADITKDVCQRQGLKAMISSAANQHRLPGINWISQPITPYEQIVRAASLTRVHTGLRFRIRFDGGRVIVAERNELAKKREEQKRYVVGGRNLRSADFEASLEKVKTELIIRAAVGIRSGGDTTQYLHETVVEASPLITVYGRLVKRIELPLGAVSSSEELRTIAKNHLTLLQRLGRKATIEADGHPLVRAGDAITFYDGRTRLFGRYFANRVTHTITGTSHTMTLEISDADKVPDIPVATSDLDPTKKSTSLFIYPLGGKRGTLGKPNSGPHSRSAGGYNWRDDDAFDLTAVKDDPVFAPAALTVTKIVVAGKRRELHLRLKDGSGELVMRYLTSDLKVHEGQAVDAGARLGTVAEVHGTIALHIAAQPLAILHQIVAAPLRAALPADPTKSTTPTWVTAPVISPVPKTTNTVGGANGYQATADKIADKHGIPRALFRALILHESAWRQYGSDGSILKSNANPPALGLCQLLATTAASLGVDPNDPAQNMEGGAKYLRSQKDAFGSWKLALAAYNAGPGNVRKFGGIPPFKETQAYVRNILADAGLSE